MSLFKERSVNAKKLISLENTISALKRELASLKDGFDKSQLVDLQKENEELRKKISLLEEELAATAQAPVSKPSTVKRKTGRKKTSSKDAPNEADSTEEI